MNQPFHADLRGLATGWLMKSPCDLLGSAARSAVYPTPRRSPARSRRCSATSTTRQDAMADYLGARPRRDPARMYQGRAVAGPVGAGWPGLILI